MEWIEVLVVESIPNLCGQNLNLLVYGIDFLLAFDFFRLLAVCTAYSR